MKILFIEKISTTHNCIVGHRLAAASSVVDSTISHQLTPAGWTKGATPPITWLVVALVFLEHRMESGWSWYVHQQNHSWYYKCISSVQLPIKQIFWVCSPDTANWLIDCLNSKTTTGFFLTQVSVCVCYYEETTTLIINLIPYHFSLVGLNSSPLNFTLV